MEKCCIAQGYEVYLAEQPARGRPLGIQRLMERSCIIRSLRWKDLLLIRANGLNQRNIRRKFRGSKHMFPICHLERMKKLKRLKVHFCEKVYFIFFTLVGNKVHFLPKVPKKFFYYLFTFPSSPLILLHYGRCGGARPQGQRSAFWWYLRLSAPEHQQPDKYHLFHGKD